MSPPKGYKMGPSKMPMELRKQIASKGGKAVSRDPSHMAAIGSKGGTKVSQDREHMRRIGSKGGIKSKRPQPYPKEE